MAYQTLLVIKCRILFLLHIPQNTSMTGASLSDCLMSYLRQSLVESNPSREMQSVYSTAAAKQAELTGTLAQRLECSPMARVIPKTLKMVLDTTLLNTQHYKVRFKGKVEQSWEWSSALPYTLV